MDLNSQSSIDKYGTSLCYKCSRISIDALVPFLFHSYKLTDIFKSASKCAMCTLICEGLLADIANKSEGDHITAHELIYVRPNVFDVFVPGEKRFFQVGLKIWSNMTHIKCMFDWHLPHNGYNGSQISYTSKHLTPSRGYAIPSPPAGSTETGSR